MADRGHNSAFARAPEDPLSHIDDTSRVPWRREAVIGPCRLLLGDARAILPALEGIDAIVSDPPYGIGFVHGGGGSAVKQRNGAYIPAGRHLQAIAGDAEPFNPAPALALGVPCILFGADRFHRHLPEGGSFHAWDKTGGGRGPDDSFADVEFVWTSWRCKPRVVSYLWKGVLQDGEKGERKYHVSQKPVAVMAWCLDMLPAKARTICDPYMGSASTALACIRTGRRFIGVEIDEAHYETALRRIERELRQGCLLRDLLPPEPEQHSLLEAQA